VVARCQRNGRVMRKQLRFTRLNQNLAGYIIRASFFQKRIAYMPEHESSDGMGKVTHESKNGNTKRTVDALDWLALLTTHIPNRGEQMLRY
jgi:hypothetical protein